MPDVDVTNLRLPRTWVTAQPNNPAFDISANELDDDIRAIGDVDWGNNSLLDVKTLEINNVAGTFQYIITGSAIIADRVTTLPLLTGPDTFVFEAFAATLTNKTITLGGNTITGTAAQFDTALTGDNFAFQSDITGFFDTAGTGLTSTGSTVNVIGTVNRITANANDIDISSAYVGQATITTLGTIATGTWEGTAIQGAETDIDITELSDVTITAVATGEIIVKSAGDWINQTLAEAGIQPAGTFFDTAGTGLTSTGSTVNVIGTSNRIVANANDIDIDSAYVGQTSITTLGTITSGTWNGTDIVFANLQDIATARIVGRVTAATGVMEELTGTQATTLLNVFTSGLKGLTPASGGSATDFLSADGTFKVPAGGGDMVLADAQTVTGAKTFADNAFLIQNPAITFEYLFQGGAILADRTITLPVLTGGDTLVFEAHIQTLTNKTIDGDDNTIVDINETQMNVSVGAATTVLTSNGVGSAPTYAAPAGGEFTAAWTADHNQGGSVFGLRDALFVDPTVTTKKLQIDLVGMTAAVTAILDFNFTTAKTITFPDTTGTVALTSDLSAFFDTAGTGLTSTGSTVNVIGTASRIVANANDIDIDSAYVGQTSLTTLGTIGTGTWEGDVVASAFLDADTMHLSVAQVVTATKTFADNALLIQNPAADGNDYLFQSAAIVADRTITLPLLTGNDTMVTEAFAATLTNKTINTASNTITVVAADMTDYASATAAFTNKTIDADGTGNVLTNIGSSEIKSEIITGQATVTAISGDFLLFSDTTDSGNLKKVDALDFLGGASQTPWASTIDAADFSLQNLDILNFNTVTDTPVAAAAEIWWNSASGMFLNVPTTDNFDFTVNGISQMTIDVANIDFQANTLIDGIVNSTITGVSGITGLGLQAQDLDMNGNDILLGATANVIKFGASESIGIEASDIVFDVSTSDSFRFDVATITQYALNPTSLDLVGNAKNITMVGSGAVGFIQMAEITDPAAGTASGKFYVKDVAAVSKPFFIGEGQAAVDLSTGTEVTTWTADHDTGGFSLTFTDDPSPPAGSVMNIHSESTDMILNVSAADLFDFRVNNGSSMRILDASIDFQASTLDDMGNTTLNAGATLTIQGTGATGFIDIDEITTPASPAANVVRLFVQDVSGDSHIFQDNSTESPIDLTTGAEVTTWTANHDAAGFNLLNLNELEIENIAGDFQYTFTGAAIVADRIITLPLLTAGDIMVTEAFTQTLTNKTIDGDDNTIVDINETQMNVSVGASTTVLTSNGVGAAPTYQAPAGGEFTAAWTADHNQTGSGFALVDARFADTSDSTKEVIMNLSGNTTAIALTIATLQSTAQTVQIPNTTGLDQFVLEDFAQTLTTKTMDADNNTFSNFEIGNEVDATLLATLNFVDNDMTTKPAGNTNAFELLTEVTAGDDSSANPMFSINCRRDTPAAITNRVIFEIENNGIGVVQVDAAGDWNFFNHTVELGTGNLEFTINQTITGSGPAITYAVGTGDSHIFNVNGLRLTIAETVITADVPLDMNQNNITDLPGTFVSALSTVTGISGDFVMISDTTDSGNLKKVDVVDFLGGGEFTAAWTADHNQAGSGFALQDARFADPTDATKEIRLTLDGMTTGIVLTLDTNQTTAQTLTIPNTTGADDFVLEDFTQTLTNKTLTTPTIGSFTNSTHDHTAGAGGGQLTNTALTSGVFAAITGIGTQGQDLNMNGNDVNLGAAGTVFFSAADTAISEQAGSMFFDVPTTESFSFDIAGAPEVTISATQMDLTGMNLVNAVMTGTVTGASAITGVGTIATGTWEGTDVATGFIADTLTGKTLTTAVIDADNNTVSNIGFAEVKNDLITGASTVTAIAGDFVLFSDTTDSGNLKKADVSDFLGGGEVFTWTADHDSDGFNLVFDTDANSGFIGDRDALVADNQIGVALGSLASLDYLFTETALDFQSNDAIDIQNTLMDSDTTHILDLERTTAQADDYVIGDIRWRHPDGAAAQMNYAKITGTMEFDNAGGNEEGSLKFFVTENGNIDVLKMAINDGGNNNMEIFSLDVLHTIINNVPRYRFYTDRTTPVPSGIGTIEFAGDSDAVSNIVFAQIQANTDVITHASRAGSLRIAVREVGAVNDFVIFGGVGGECQFFRDVVLNGAAVQLRTDGNDSGDSFFGESATNEIGLTAGGQEYNWTTSQFLTNNKDVVLGSGDLFFLTAGTGISEQSSDMIFDVSTGDFFSFDIAGVPEITITDTQMDMNQNNIIDLPGTFISALSTVTGISGDFVMISDTTDSGNLKKVDVVDFLGGGEFTAAWTANHNQGGSTFSLEDARFADPTDDTKTIQLNLAGMTTAIELTLSTSQSTAQTITIPNTTGADDFVLEDFAQALTNKTIVAGSNTITGLTNAALASGDFNAITGIGVQAQTLDMAANTISWSTDGHSIASGATDLTLNASVSTDAVELSTAGVTRLSATNTVVALTVPLDMNSNNITELPGTFVSALATVTAVSGDFIMFSDTTDSGNLKKADASDFLGGGSQSPWVTTIDAADFSLQNLDILQFNTVTDTPVITEGEIYYDDAVTGMNFNAKTADEFTWRINGAIQMSLNIAQGLDLRDNNLDIQLGDNQEIIWAGDGDRRINNNTAGMTFSVGPDPDAFEFEIAGVSVCFIDQEELDMVGRNIDRIDNVIFADSSTVPLTTQRAIHYDDAEGMVFNALTGDFHQFEIAGVEQFKIDATTVSLLTNDLDITAGDLTFSTNGHSIEQNTTTLDFDLGAVTDTYQFHFTTGSRFNFSNDAITLQFVDLRMNANRIEFATTNSFIDEVTSRMTYSVASPAGHTFIIQATDRLLIDEDGIDSPEATSPFTEVGVPISPIGIHDIWIPATAMWDSTTGGCAPIAKTELATDQDIQTLDFDGGSIEAAQFNAAFPKNWDAGVITVTFYWSALGTQTTDVDWRISGVSIADNQVLTTGYGSAITVTDAHNGTANDLDISAATADVTIAGAGKSEMQRFLVERNGTADTMTQDARLHGIMLHITTDAATAV